METKAAIYCGGIKPGDNEDEVKVLGLNLWPKAGRTNLRLEVSRLYDKFWQDIPQRYEDLLEIATYIYSGDQAVKRGGEEAATMGGKWRRRYHYHIPVRVPDFWDAAEVKATLRQTLEFLSDDYYDFTFYSAANAPEVQTFLKIEAASGKFIRPERIALFSGGLDSLAGVVEEAVGEKRKLLLVNHRSCDKFSPRYETLVEQLTGKVSPVPLSQLRVLINKQGVPTEEYTQRARSFLFAAMGMTVAAMLKLDELTCFENGVVSLNLPLCEQIVGAKATRTTHPRVIRGLEQLAKLMAGGKDFQIRTPFFWNTKGEVVEKIIKNKCESLIGLSRSCAGTILRSNAKPQCGVCSQCIDRRVGVLAAGGRDYDPAEGYAVDFFRESLPKTVDKIMAASFVNRAQECSKYQNAVEFIGDYPEVLLALPYLDGTRSGLAERILKLYQRHAEEVDKALELMQIEQAKAGRRRNLPADCLLRIMLDPGAVTVLPAAGTAPTKLVNGDTKGQTPSVATAGEEGRLRWENDFEDIWVGADHYDLRKRNTARHCIRFLVMMKAFDKATARHLEKEIEPHVREYAKLEKLPSSADGNLRIQRYFNDPEKKYHALRKELVKSAGRNRCFYLQVT